MWNQLLEIRRLVRLSQFALLSGTLVALILAQAAQAQTFTVLYAFTGGADGAEPAAPLYIDAAGNLYGTTAFGGRLSACQDGCGVVFKLDPTGNETVLYRFGGYEDGSYPRGALIRDTAGNLYGTTYFGGTGFNVCSEGCGVVFKLTSGGTESVLHAFKSVPGDGARAIGGLVSDNDGSLYGTTVFGGGVGPGNGTVFKLTPSGAETIVHTFSQETDGANPYCALAFDQGGDLFGTTYSGGTTRLYGTVFETTPTGDEKLIYNFMGGSDGCNPTSDLVVDEAGNLYGTTSDNGGTCGGDGTLFKVTLGGEKTVLHSFTGGSDGAFPFSGVIRDTQGNLYGTTPYGGIATGFSGYGVVYKIDTSGVETVLHTFRGGIDGYSPNGLTMDAAGNLYGTTALGGPYNSGVVFKIVP